jgi:hypothetical protein
LLEARGERSETDERMGAARLAERSVERDADAREERRSHTESLSTIGKPAATSVTRSQSAATA